MADTVDWIGASGKRYTYHVHILSQTFTDTRGGNYIFCFLNQNNRWQAVYIGETGDFSERFDNHHKMPCIRSHRATHIHAHLSGAKASRLAEEKDLVANYNPPCNG